VPHEDQNRSGHARPGEDDGNAEQPLMMGKLL
jgi:hypothetical protein